MFQDDRTSGKVSLAGAGGAATIGTSGAAATARERYPFALACVAAAAAVVAAVDVMLALTPLVLFAVAVAASAARGGTRPGLLAAGLAALVSNYLFIAPRYEFSFDWEVARFIVLYIVSVPIARLIAARLRRLRADRAASTPPSDVLPLASLGVIAPVLVGACALVAVVVPAVMSSSGRPAPVPAGVIVGGVFLAAATLWRRWGR